MLTAVVREPHSELESADMYHPLLEQKYPQKSIIFLHGKGQEDHETDEKE